MNMCVMGAGSLFTTDFSAEMFVPPGAWGQGGNIQLEQVFFGICPTM